MSTRQEFLEMLRNRGATKEQAARALQMKREQGIPFDDELVRAASPDASGVAPREQLTAEQEAFRAQPTSTKLGQSSKEHLREMVQGLMAVGAGVTPEVPEGQIYPPGMTEEQKGAVGQDIQGWQDASQQARNRMEGDPTATIGRLGTDLALTALPMGMGAKLGTKAAGLIPKLSKVVAGGLGVGTGSAAVHQLQEIGTTGEVDLPGTVVEIATSGLLPGLGQVAGKGIKKGAGKVLHTAVKPPRKYMESVNPPNFIKPLQERLITKFGGLEKGLENTTDMIRKLSEQRDELIAGSGININVTNTLRKVNARLNKMVKNGEINADDAAKAAQFSKGALRTAQKQPSKVVDIIEKEIVPKGELFIPGKISDITIRESKTNPGMWEKVTKNFDRRYAIKMPAGPNRLYNSKEEALATLAQQNIKIPTEKLLSAGKTTISGSDAVKLRKLADKNSKFNPYKQAVENPDKIVFNEAYRRVMEDEIESQLLSMGGEVSKRQYKMLKKELASLVPFQKAAIFRLAQENNNYKLNLMDFAAMGVGSSLGGFVPAAGLGIVRRLTATPGGSKMLYELGDFLDVSIPAKQFIKQLGAQVARSTGYDSHRESKIIDLIDKYETTRNPARRVMFEKNIQKLLKPKLNEQEITPIDSEI